MPQPMRHRVPHIYLSRIKCGFLGRSYAATTGGQGKLTYLIHLPYLSVVTALSIFMLASKAIFADVINKNKGNCH
jgi:hypothetical protein